MTDPAFLVALNGHRPPAHSLVADPRCELAAQPQADECARRDEPTHTGRDGSNVRDRAYRVGIGSAVVGEVAAQGWPPRPHDLSPASGWPENGPVQALEQWRHSPAHWAILTDPRFDRIGLAVTLSGASGRPYWVAVLAGKDATASPPPFIDPIGGPPRPGLLDRLFGWLGWR